MSDRLCIRPEGPNESLIGTPKKLSKQSPLNIEFDNLREQIEYVENMVGDLTEKLGPFLHPATPDDKGEVDSKVHETMSPFVEAIRCTKNKILRIKGRIQDLFNDLEI